MHIKKIILTLGLFIFCNANAEQFSIPTVGAPHSPFWPKFIEVYGHRGARSYSPENTIPSYRTALKVGVNWIDADIVISKDHKIVVYHDLFLNPNIVRDKAGNFVETKEPIYKLTAKQIQQYDVGMLNPNSDYAKFFPDQVPVNGAKIPLLEEVIQYINKNSKRQVYFQFEIKTDPKHDDWSASPEEYANVLYSILKKYNITDRVEVQAFDWRYLYALQKLDARIKTLHKINHIIKTQYLAGHVELEEMNSQNESEAGLWTGGKLLKDYDGNILKMIKALGGCCYGPEDVILTKEQVDEAHKLGLKVVTWTWPEHIGTAFDEEVIKRLIDWGVDGIITDDPGRLNSMLAARNYPVPRNYAAR